MKNAAERILRMRRKIAEDAAAKARAGGQSRPHLTDEQVLEAAKARMSAALGPDAPLPPALTAIERREARERLRDEVERLSREGLKIEQIVARTGLKYGLVCKIRHDRQVNPRKPRRPASDKPR